VVTMLTSPLLDTATALGAAPDIVTLPQSSEAGSATKLAGLDSAAPASHAAPWGRDTPRWSGWPAVHVPAPIGRRSSAGLSGSTTRRVCVSPPWSASGDSPASVTPSSSVPTGAPVHP
jgi:hypothetical protein